MDRRTFLAATGAVFLAAPLAALALQPGRLPRIGVLWPISDNAELEAFRQGLHELGYMEQQNICREASNHDDPHRQWLYE